LKSQGPTLDEWGELYKAAIKIKEIAPWQWMEEDELFAVKDPKSGKLGFISVMGTIGEHYAIAMYLGEKGYYGFQAMKNYPDTSPPEMFFSVPQLQASFENREFLDRQDRDIIKKLGLTFRGKQAWPIFRSYRPGCAPWYLEADEARFLTQALEQTADVALRYKDDSSLLYAMPDNQILIRVSSKKGNQLEWKDTIGEIPPQTPSKITIAVDESVIKMAKSTRWVDTTFEIDLFMAPAPVKDDVGGRPFFPYVLMIVEAENGLIVGHELLPPVPSLEQMWGVISMRVATMLVNVKMLPQKIVISSELVYQLLLRLSDALNIQIERVDHLPNLDQAGTGLLHFLSR